MTLAKEVAGLTCVIIFAIYINRLISQVGFKRDPLQQQKEMPLENLSCNLVNPLDEDDWPYKTSLEVESMYVGEDLIFLTAKNSDHIYMIDTTEDLTGYALPLFEEVKLLEYDGKLTFGAITGYQSRDGRLLIYVYNRTSRNIEKFEYNSGLNVLTWQKSFSSPSMHDVTGIHVLVEDNFYYTINGYARTGTWLRKIEDASLIRLGAIGLCKTGVNADCKQITPNDLGSPYGMISKKIFDEEKQISRHFLYVSQSTSTQVGMYEIEYDYRLTFGKEIDASNQMRNFHLGEEDEIFLVGNPMTFTPNGFRTSTEVLKLDGLDKFEHFYLNTEDNLSVKAGAIRQSFTILPSEDGAEILICK